MDNCFGPGRIWLAAAPVTGTRITICRLDQLNIPPLAKVSVRFCAAEDWSASVTVPALAPKKSPWMVICRAAAESPAELYGLEICNSSGVVVERSHAVDRK